MDMREDIFYQFFQELIESYRMIFYRGKMSRNLPRKKLDCGIR